MKFMKKLFSALLSCSSFECRYQDVCASGDNPICYNAQPFEYCVCYLEDRCSACSHLWDCQKFEARRFLKNRKRGDLNES